MLDGKDEMTVDKAIKICREKSKNIKLKVDPDVFVNIAEWLEELKRLRLEPVITNTSKMARAYNNGYSKGIDDCMNALCKHCMTTKNECIDLACPFYIGGCGVVNITQKLKQGVLE